MSYYGSEFDIEMWRIVQDWKQRRSRAMWHGVCIGFLVGCAFATFAWWVA